MKMLPKNVVMMKEFERQNRLRLQKEAENARNLAGTLDKAAPKLKFPAWEFTLRKFRTLRTRLNPTG
jgi:hypothetical protein